MRWISRTSTGVRFAFYDTCIGVRVVSDQSEYGFCGFSFGVDDVEAHLAVDCEHRLFADDLASR